MMSRSKPTTPAAALFFLIILSMASFKLIHCIGNNSTTFCPQIEKEALLSFKQSLQDPLNILPSWNDTDEVNCCNWNCVVCSNFTGHVLQLHLQSSGLFGKLNPSLLNLKQLSYLDLSFNEFNETIPSFIGSLTSLEYLDLSGAGFYGTIPDNIGNLSNLHTLSLKSRYYLLNVDSLEWLSGLSRLEHLDMDWVNLSRAANWAEVINTLPSLVELRFSYCALIFTAQAQLNHINITSLEVLDLSFNYFNSVILRWIFQLSKLIFLDLSSNHFEGPIPTASNTTNLQYIDLSDSYLNSTIPDWLYFCKDLEFLSLSTNSLHGTISTSIANTTSLERLQLSRNNLSGKIPTELSDALGALDVLDLSRNQLSGHLTDLFGLKSLRFLALNINSFSGNLPESMGQLFNLEFLDIEDNMLEGVVTERHFANLTKLTALQASGNHLSLRVSPNWIPPFNLNVLRLGSWNLGIDSGIPSWLQTQKGISGIDLSHTGISGYVPSWFWDIPELNLAHNHLHGEIPDVRSPAFGFLYLSSNQFSGLLPRVAKGVIGLDLSNNSFSGGISHFLCDTPNDFYYLKILHLGGNRLTGEIPDCWMKWPGLTYLNLGNNNLSGGIPTSIGFLEHLQSLNLNNNGLFGQIPFSVRNCTKLVKIDFDTNRLNGIIPPWIVKSLTDLRFLILRSNKLSGKIPSNICRLNYLQILDLSDNKLSGMIPRCVKNFTAMATKTSMTNQLYGEEIINVYSSIGVFSESASVATKGRELQYNTILSLVKNIDLSKNNLSGDIPKELTSLVELGSLNLSGNQFTGMIPYSIGDMKQLESLDLSRNSLSGEIPNSFITMSSLSSLNLSYNYLTGRIPESTQIMGFNASSFIGNNLCGPPLPINCSNDDEDEDEDPGKKEDDTNEGIKFSNIDWFYVFLSLGYAVGFSVVCTTLVLKKSWREAYFGWSEDVWNKVYVYFHIKWKRLREL